MLVRGSITSLTEKISTEMEIEGTCIQRMSYTFPQVMTAAAVLNHDVLRSFVGSNLFEGPSMSLDGKVATFVRKSGV